METYVTVSFWIGVIGVVCNLILVCADGYPKVKTETLGGKVVSLIVGGAFCAWAGVLIYG